jgi:hypothetical protein
MGRVAGGIMEYIQILGGKSGGTGSFYLSQDTGLVIIVAAAVVLLVMMVVMGRGK